MNKYYEWSQKDESFIEVKKPKEKEIQNVLYYTANSTHYDKIVQFEKCSYQTEGHIFLGDFDEEKFRVHLFRNRIEDIENYKLLIAEHKEEIVGRIDLTWMYDVDKESSIGFINWIYVLKPYRNMAAGKGLIDFCKSELRKMNINTVKLLVGKGNLAALEFYKNSGFNLNSNMTVCELDF
ncbi:MAG: GNAT family N-acetyltransferase [Candidatus Sabulitectum sp.]|nr:GNAT family N-acetyltransferase [Candidatus Sabulitectum sp.]